MREYTDAQLRTLDAGRLDLLADALESGEYAKGEGWLAWREDEDSPWKMCCMGVASEIAIQHGADVPVTVRGQFKGYGEYGIRDVLCGKVAEWYGFTPPGELHPRIPLEDGTMILMGPWNDRGPGLARSEEAMSRAGGYYPKGSEPSPAPEPDFTTIAAGVRRLARMAREAQAKT